jgi:hypothetical protein
MPMARSSVAPKSPSRSEVNYAAQARERPTQIAPHIYQQRLAEWAPVSREAEGK